MQISLTAVGTRVYALDVEARVPVNHHPLCITADDYGWAPDINEAIESLAATSRISAVSVMAHRDADLSTARRLVDAGVCIGLHLCFTNARPTSNALGELLPQSYPQLFVRIARQPNFLTNLQREARAQIQKLQAHNLPVHFLNAHEHVHLFPPLWPMIVDLARELGVRAIRSALGQPIDASAAGALALASRLSWALNPLPDITILSPLGVARAGTLTRHSIAALLGRPFRSGPRIVQELCMHPGFANPGRRAEYDLLASGVMDSLVPQPGSMFFPR